MKKTNFDVSDNDSLFNKPNKSNLNNKNNFKISTFYKPNLQINTKFILRLNETSYLIDIKNFTPKISLDKVGEILSHFEDIETSHLTQLADEVYTHQKNLPYPKTSKHNFFSKSDKNNLTAGALSGALSRTFTAPLDRLKIIYQSIYVKGATPNLYLGLKQIYLNDGIAGLFTSIWVRLPGLPLEFWVEDVFQGIAHTFVELLSLDPVTISRKRMSYARFCVGVTQGVDMPDSISLTSKLGI